MTRLEYLLMSLAEECGELAQISSKCFKWGMDGFHPLDPSTNNYELLQSELADVIGIVNLIEDKCGHFAYNQKFLKRISNKRDRINACLKMDERINNDN